jgi:hypothetical protein
LSIAPSSSGALPSSTSIELEPSIHDCPPEDIAEYPVLDPLPPPTPRRPRCLPSKLSVEELSFGKQGGVRCVTVSPDVETMNTEGSSNIHIDYYKWTSNIEDSSDFKEHIKIKKDVKRCYYESGEPAISDSAGNFLGTRYRVTELTCHWFTVTLVDAKRMKPRTLHISVNQNKTGKKRKKYVEVRGIGCSSGFTITQSAE